jgi:hypothetical protein
LQDIHIYPRRQWQASSQVYHRYRLRRSVYLCSRASAKVYPWMMYEGRNAIAMALDVYGHASPRLQEEAPARTRQVLFNYEQNLRTQRQRKRGTP